MADYARITARAEYSKSSDYSSPRIPMDFFTALALTPDNYDVREIDVTTSGLTVDLSAFGTITAILVQATHASNTLTAEWFTQIGTQAADDLAFANANPDTIADNNTSGTFITNGAVNGGYVRIASAEDSANDAAFLISQAVDGDNLTLGPAEALTANTNDTAATLSFERKNMQPIPAGGFLLITGNVVAAGDLVLDAIGGTCETRVTIFGT